MNIRKNGHSEQLKENAENRRRSKKEFKKKKAV